MAREMEERSVSLISSLLQVWGGIGGPPFAAAAKLSSRLRVAAPVVTSGLLHATTAGGVHRRQRSVLDHTTNQWNTAGHGSAAALL